MGCCDAPGLMPIEEAMANILQNTHTVKETETLPLDKALGRVLASDILSPIHVPPFDNSAMDGYAVRIADLKVNATLPLAGQSFAGAPLQGQWPALSCIRIMTGAQIPQGCDAVIMQELVTVTGDGIVFDPANVKPNQNIRPVGDDIKTGQLVLSQGKRLTARDLPMLASLGVADIHVYRKPIVATFSTGDELKPVGVPLGAGEIYDSNRYGTIPLFEKFGCEVVDLGVIPDDPKLLVKAFEEAQSKADVVVTSGGVSVGEADFTKDILEQTGEIGFWKLAIKPGKPFAFGKLDHALFCGLPGNPVSAFMTAYILVQPLLAKMSGDTAWKAEPIIQAKTHSAFKKSPGRTDYQRGIYSINEKGEFEVETTGNQSSGAFRSMSLANCFVILERERGRVEVGETVQIQLFNSTLY
ncbi:molybdopterin molybdenumtransferase MoeA [Vibrio sp. UCD-FRSSP16_10]|uniref:molybdopterin molybdotransferase MoeA n=1 Tax=unclassified Vibrio TaxID=2614977 RepID=UPI00080017E5|nr:MULTISPECIES: molybdopterin molybdotransferase MoeA [unclassified Vibrio]OBT15497.1 molybdopterin molybdenumtransferase MoeA [Vibrio sp. UCD-FRSSP16_30]OBT20570.1 molybdopterin molybdenumtransferase MoeA [Vibrio sp. UCD-FRSSP16_10]